MILLYFLSILSAFAQLGPADPALELCQTLILPQGCECIKEAQITKVQCSCQKLWESKPNLTKSIIWESTPKSLKPRKTYTKSATQTLS